MEEAAFSLPAAQETELQIDEEEMPSGSRSQDIPTNFVSTTFHSKDVPDQCAKPGQCGLYNLGNTCFMNSGLQSLMSTAPLVKFFLEQFSLDDPHQDSLTTNFYQLMCKLWSGRYSIIFPRDFKNALALFHIQFQDFRQHDCQEFLALFLDTLHQQLKSRDEKSPNFNGNDIIVSSKCAEGLNNSPNVKSSLSFDAQQSLQSSRECSSQDEENVSYVIQSELPTLLKSVVTTDSNSDLEQLDQDSNELKPILNNASNLKQNIPKIEEFYAKDTKTLNTNVLSSDFESKTLTTDSEKFPKQEVNNGSVHHNELGLHVAAESLTSVTVKDESPRKGIKATNILADKNNKVQNPIESDPQNDSISKKMKFECAEKNFQYKALSKINKDFNITEQNLHLASFGDEGVNLIKDLGILGSLDSDMCENVMRRTHLLVDRKNSITNGVGETATSCQGDNELETNDEMDTTYKLDSSKGADSSEVLKNRSKNSKSKQAYHFENKVSKKLKTEKQEEHAQVNIGGTCVIVDDDVSCVAMDSPANRESDMDVPMENDEDENDNEEIRDNDELIEKEEEEEAADRAWEDYVKDNHSVIVSSFQGQFKSTVICSECNHVSVTYEPFMYLSVPLPHACDRQLCVFLVSPGEPVTQYVLTLMKSDKVSKVKDKLKSVIKRPNCDIIMAEVFDNHVSRVLEDNVMLRYVNDSTRKIYAFEMLPAPENSLCDSDKNIVDPPAIIITSDSNTDGDVFSNMGTFTKPNVDDINSFIPTTSAGAWSSSECSDSNIPFTVDSSNDQIIAEDRLAAADTLNAGLSDSVQKSLSDSLSEWTNNDSDEIRQCLNQTKMETGTSIWDNESGHVSAGRSSPVNEASWGTSDNLPIIGSNEQDSMSPGWNMSHMLPFEETVVGSSNNAVSSVSWDTMTTNAPANETTSNLTATAVVDSWKSCAICLEELEDAELVCHTCCGGNLCHNCLEMSIKHYGEESFSCPVCSVVAVLSEDFFQLGGGEKGIKKQTRVLLVSLALRNIVNDKQKLLGHPRLAYLQNNITGQQLYQIMAEVFPDIHDFTILLTDGQGLHCSRCVFTEQCKGCPVSVEGEINLRPGDCLTLCVDNLTGDQIDNLQRFENHESMATLRPEKALTLFDCLQAFTDVEVLDEHNPWFCPRCQKNQCARKTITVWQYPDILIIHLKRFVFHDLSSTKVDAGVIFPLEDLNLTKYISGPDSGNLTYDLYSIVCHFGGASAGHYTTYSKHPLDGEWYYYNDETVTPQSPGQDDYKNGYILFYRRQGIDNKFEPPSLPPEADFSMTCDGGELDENTSQELSQTLNNRNQQAATENLLAAESVNTDRASNMENSENTDLKAEGQLEE